MTDKELFYFTGQCLALDDHPEFSEETIQKINSGLVDWDKFVWLCSNHLILPAIYLKFRDHDIVGHLPNELSEFLKEIYQLNLSRNSKILEQLHDITRLLNQHDIYPIYLKGTGNMLDDLYCDRGERLIGDIDLLVPEKDYLRAVTIMKEDGYQTSSPVYFDVEKLKHYPGLSKEGAATHIEIHRLPVSDDYKQWFNPSIIDTQKKAVSGLQGCYVLSDHHKIIHNFIHGQLGHKAHIYGVVSLRDIYDLYLFSKRSTIEDTLREIKSKRKAIAYFVYVAKALGLKEKLYSTDNLTSRLFILKHDLNITSPLFYHTHRYAVYFSQRILIGYLGQFIQCFYSRDTRKSVISRLINPQWYKAHL
ncbi:MAG TPA: nucleotidyltransferase family protein, partial [Prolixibacteraceae bacterium]|nr:nucleotidyltransferase family protein [Prolixibacteraceae bacterium]